MNECSLIPYAGNVLYTSAQGLLLLQARGALGVCVMAERERVMPPPPPPLLLLLCVF